MTDPSAFFQAIKQGNIEQVLYLLRGNPSLAATRMESGETPLLLAKYYGQDAVVQALLETGLQPDLFEAAALGLTDRVRELLDQNAGRVNDFSSDGFTPLQLAAYFGHAQTARLLLERGADVSPVSRNPMQVTAIHACVASGNAASRVEIARALVEKGADINAKHPGGYTPLHAAAQNGDLELARLLLDRDAIPSAVTDKGETPLSLAEEKGHSDVATLLRTVSGAAD